MTGDKTEQETEDDVVSEDATDENIVLDTSDEGFADTIVEANVDALVAKLDSTDAEELARKRAAHKQLEELRELENSGLDDTFDFDMDEDP